MESTGHTLFFDRGVHVCAAAGVAGPAEGKGPLGEAFDVVLTDDRLGEQTFERGEKRMLMEAARLCLGKGKLDPENCGCFLCGDLLNQIVTSSFAARELGLPYLGLYGACSTMTEGLLLGGVLTDGGYRPNALCAASSHFPRQNVNIVFRWKWALPHPLPLSEQPPAQEPSLYPVNLCPAVPCSMCG